MSSPRAFHELPETETAMERAGHRLRSHRFRVMRSVVSSEQSRVSFERHSYAHGAWSSCLLEVMARIASFISNGISSFPVLSRCDSAGVPTDGDNENLLPLCRCHGCPRSINHGWVIIFANIRTSLLDEPAGQAWLPSPLAEPPLIVAAAVAGAAGLVECTLVGGSLIFSLTLLVIPLRGFSA